MPRASQTHEIASRVEMFQKERSKDQFFNMKALAPRPQSDATEMYASEMSDTDFEDDESVIEEADSPRLSLNSSGRRSETTLSSFEEVQTPGPNEFQGFNFDLPPTRKKPVEGPKGPHLFRSSIESHDEFVLGMSPLTPRVADIQTAATDAPMVPEIPRRHRFAADAGIADELNLNDVPNWTPRQVAQWMWKASFEQSIVEKFEENDISGAILVTLKFEDLRELDIPSFGQRTKLWDEIHFLRGEVPSTPKPPTPIEEAASPCIERAPRHTSKQGSRRDKSRSHSHDCESDDEPRKQRSTKKRHPKRSDIVSPLESVSIVGIEQIMPKPHKCSKGENCSKWRKQQRLIDSFKAEHPMYEEFKTPIGHPVSPEQGGSIWIAGNPGNPETAEAIRDTLRPVSDAVPSVVASSDVLGPGYAPSIHHLEEASLKALESRDPQEHVKQFIQFQHMDPTQVNWSSEVPPTPPYEMFPTIPPQQQPHARLQALPRLAIPPPRPAPPPRSASAQPFSPYAMERVEAQTPELRNLTQSPGASVYRFGTPFSDADVPVTAIPLGPISRDASQSVPPNMNFRSPVAPIQRTQSRASARRPSFQALPRVDENAPIAPVARPVTPPRSRDANSADGNQQWSYPWSAVDSQPTHSVDDATHSGWMKKRKTKMLRHEWHEHHFTLKGTRLAMHKDARALETLEYIDVDDYAIACSSLASGSKLDAAFKAMNISRGKPKGDEAAFSFQLIPAAIEKGQRLRKRESMMNGSQGEAAAKGKVHHFAVKSRDERIDWMRELMLAKALKQKNEGYTVNVNGIVI